MNPGTVTKLVSLNKNYSLIFLDDYCAKVEVFMLRYSKASNEIEPQKYSKQSLLQIVLFGRY